MRAGDHSADKVTGTAVRGKVGVALSLKLLVYCFPVK